MKVTEVNIRGKVNNKDGLLAFASAVLDNGLAINELRIIRTKMGRLTIQYPKSPFCRDAASQYLYRPINDATRRLIEQAVLEKYRAECD